MSRIVQFFQAATLRSNAWREKLAGIYAFAEKAHWQIQVVPFGTTASDIRYLMDTWKPVGCIVDRALSNGQNPTRLFRGVPIVLLDHDPQHDTHRVSSVNSDASATAVLAANELMAMGLTHFSYVPHATRAYWNRQREQDFAAIVRRAGRIFMPWGTSPFASRVSKTRQDHKIAARLKAFPKPFGLFCANDQVAERVLAVALRTGFAVPDDLAVVGVDNDPIICENTTPTLTSIQPDFRGGGYAAARLLQRTIENPNTPPRVETYESREVIRRQSTQHRAAKESLVTRARRLMAEKCDDPTFRTDTLARQLRCSRSLLEMRFRDLTGLSIREEIHRLRLAKAMDLLRNPQQSITPIPSLCGYASESFFKRLFKRRTGLTMREWQKKNAKTASHPHN